MRWLRWLAVAVTLAAALAVVLPAVGGGSRHTAVRPTIVNYLQSGMERKSDPITLGPGQAVLIDKTDLICVFGGPANEIGMACLHTKTSAKATYTFRLDEDDVKIYRRIAGKTSVIRTWREPVTRKQPRSPAVSTFKTVGSLALGGQVRPAGMDIGCAVYAVAGHPVVECAKLGRDGHPLAQSYAASASPAGIEVVRFDAAHHPTSLFVAREGTR